MSDTYEHIIYLMLGNDREFTEKCLLKLYNLQLEEEREMEQTAPYNGVGFNKGDAMFLTRMAKAIIQGNKITEEDWAKIATKLEKYSTQLAQYPEIISLLR